MSDNVVNLDDFRAPEKRALPCLVTFVGHQFKSPGGDEVRLFFNIRVESGDYESAIDAVRQNGGCHVPDPDGVSFWFLPWPCAAVRIRYLAK